MEDDNIAPTESGGQQEELQYLNAGAFNFVRAAALLDDGDPRFRQAVIGVMELIQLVFPEEVTMDGDGRRFASHDGFYSPLVRAARQSKHDDFYSALVDAVRQRKHLKKTH